VLATELQVKQGDATYTREEKLGSNERPPLSGVHVGNDLGRDGADELADGEPQLIGADHETTDLVRRQFGDVGDKGAGGQAYAEADDAGGSKPMLPLLGENLSDGASEEQDNGEPHARSSAEAIREPATQSVSRHLSHLGETLQVGDDRGTDGRLAVDSGVGHVLDEGDHGEDVSGNLLLEAVDESGPVEDGAKEHGLPQNSGRRPATQFCPSCSATTLDLRGYGRRHTSKPGFEDTIMVCRGVGMVGEVNDVRLRGQGLDLLDRGRVVMSSHGEDEKARRYEALCE